MLSPFKSFLSSLQKNAIGATIFGLSPNMTSQGETESDSMATSSASGQESFNGIDRNSDSIVDPNRELIEKDLDSESLSQSHLNSLDNVNRNLLENSIDKSEIELQQLADDTFTRIDPDLLAESDQDNYNLQTPHALTVTDPDSLIDPDPLIDDPLNDHLADPLALEDILSNEGSNSVNITDIDGDGQVTIVDVETLKKDTNTCGSENEADDSFETTVLDIGETGEECVRSDGSDSGLGSDSTTLAPPVTIKPINANLVPTRSSLKRRSDGDLSTHGAKRQKKNIQFNEVTVYYFPRTQGFTCVPSQGGCTLGMESQHIHIKSFSLAEHAAEQRRVHRQQLQDLHPNGSSTEETESDEEQSENSGSEFDTEPSGFLQPVNARQRRNMLRAVGIRKIDSIEKDECRTIRTSREFCGCNCRGYCDPDTCSCSQNGIKCQVDRPNFPCGCTRDGCGNVVGRVEFNPVRVRTHFIHTIMRLELEKKQNRTEDQSFTNPNNMNWNQPRCLQNIGLDNMTLYNSIYNNSNNSNSLTTDVVDRQVNCNNLNQTDGAHLMELGQMRSGGNESLDLHYAYRDDYSTNMVHSTDELTNIGDSQVVESSSIGSHKIYEQTNSNTLENCAYTGFNGHDHFSNYTGTTYNVDTHHNHLHSDEITASCSSYSTFQIDCTDNINHTTEELKNEIASRKLECDKDLVNLLPLSAANSSELHAINDLLENSRNASVAAPTTQLSETSVLNNEPSSSLSECHKIEIDSMEKSETMSLKILNDEEPKDNLKEESSVEIDENLSEVIKKSIVETASV